MNVSDLILSLSSLLVTAVQKNPMVVLFGVIVTEYFRGVVNTSPRLMQYRNVILPLICYGSILLVTRDPVVSVILAFVAVMGTKYLARLISTGAVTITPSASDTPALWDALPPAITTMTTITPVVAQEPSIDIPPNV